MLKIEKTDIYGWEAAIRGARNSFNSWDKSDSYKNYYVKYENDSLGQVVEIHEPHYCVGAADLTLMKKLAKAGPSHAKYRRFITVTMDVTGPLYWWKEMDTYKVGTVGNSCSTMHKIADKEFELEDFSHEHLLGFNYALNEEHMNDIYPIVTETGGEEINWSPMTYLDELIKALNFYRNRFITTKDKGDWWQMIQLLPSSYNQKRTLLVNYEVLANIYQQRKGHKLDEWRTFCEWIEGLPMSEIITGISYEPDSNTIEKVAERFEKLGEGYTVSPEELKDLMKGDSND